MLLIHDPALTAARLAAGTLACPAGGCDGQLGPWGHARPRSLRFETGSEAHTPRRVRCRACGRTHVLVATRSYPRRVDSVETVGVALLAAAGGLGHRRVAERVGVPATTVRGWLRRARSNSDAYRWMRSVGTEAGQDHVHPHMLRAGFIMAGLDAGVPRRDVQVAARHAGPRTTTVYDRRRQNYDRHAVYAVVAFVTNG